MTTKPQTYKNIIKKVVSGINGTLATILAIMIVPLIFGLLVWIITLIIS